MASTASIITGRLPPLPSMRDIIKLYKLRALKQLSQNFLLDEKLNNKIVNVAGFIQDSEICEVGPGPGNITRSIINHGAEKVFVIEKDKRFIPALEMLADAASQPLLIISGDALTFNMERLFSEEKLVKWEDDFPKIQLIGNLPFNVSTPLIIKWVEAMATRSSAWRYGRVRMTLTFQKEVAERMASPIMTSQRCRLSVMCQNWCRVEHRFTIPGRAFLPKPQVDVGVVHFKPLIKPIIPLPFELVEKVVRCLFSQRRAPSIRGLQILFPHPVREKLAHEMFEVSELDPYCKPFQFTIPEIGRLCAAYKRIIEREPSYIKYNQHDKKDPHYWEDKEADEEMKSKKVLEDIEKECENDETLPKIITGGSDTSVNLRHSLLQYDKDHLEKTAIAYEPNKKLEHVRNTLDVEMDAQKNRNRKEREINDSCESEDEVSDGEESSIVDDAGHTDWETDSSDDESFERDIEGARSSSNYEFKNAYKRTTGKPNDRIRRMDDWGGCSSDDENFEEEWNDNEKRRGMNADKANNRIRRMDGTARESFYNRESAYKRDAAQSNHRFRPIEDTTMEDTNTDFGNSYKRNIGGMTNKKRKNHNDQSPSFLNEGDMDYEFQSLEDIDDSFGNDCDPSVKEHSYKRNIGAASKKRRTYNDDLPSFLTEGDADYEFQSLEDNDNPFENDRDPSVQHNSDPSVKNNSNKKITWIRPQIRDGNESPKEVEPDYYDDDLRLSRKFRKRQKQEEPLERSSNKNHFDWQHNKSLGFEGDRVISGRKKRIGWKNKNIGGDGGGE